jgi:hypothetical protein
MAYFVGLEMLREDYGGLWRLELSLIASKQPKMDASILVPHSIPECTVKVLSSVEKSFAFHS